MSDQPFEYYVPLVKERDNYKCQEPGCFYSPNEKMLRVVRVDPYEADSMKNLTTKCKWHSPEWE